MFWKRYDMLWFILTALMVGEVILVRMGIRIFNREELLGREIDNINLRRGWHLFKGYLLDYDVRQLLRINRASLAIVLVALVAAAVIGWRFAVHYPLPAKLLNLEDISREAFDQFEGTEFMPSLSIWGILSHNVRTLLAAGLLAVLSLGSLAIVLLMAPIALIGFATAQVAMAGYNPWVFIGAFILPHGVVELPAAILATAAAVRLGIAVVSPPPGMTVSQSWLQALAHFLKLFVLVILPLLALAALIEVHITPEIVVAVYGN